MLPPQTISAMECGLVKNVVDFLPVYWEESLEPDTGQQQLLWDGVQ